MFAGQSFAQEAGTTVIADDFNADSLLYTTERFQDRAGNGTATGEIGGIRLEAESGGGLSDNIKLDVWRKGDSLSTTVRFDEQSELGTPDNGAQVSLGGSFYNDSQNGGDGDTDAGDVYANLGIAVTGGEATLAFYCLSRSDGQGGATPVGIGDENGCLPFEGVTPMIGQDHELSIVLDRTARTMTFAIDGIVESVDLTSDAFIASRERKSINVDTSSENVRAVVIVDSISIGDFTDTLDTPAVIDRYQPLFDGQNPGNTVSVIGGSARISSVSSPGLNNGISVFPVAATDHLEAVVTLSSESMVEGQGRIIAGLDGRFYNDTATGGFNGREGDVRASLEFEMRGNGLQRAEYCLRRADDASSNDQTGLLTVGDDTRRCVAFSVRPQFDTAYRLSISLDRQASTITFRMNNRVFEQSIVTPIFDSSEPVPLVNVSSSNAAEVVALLDDLRTAPEALTVEEMNDGPAPQVPVGSDEGVEGDLEPDNPLPEPTEPQALNFSDDFSSETLRYAIDADRRDGQEQGRRQVLLDDGAILLRTASGVDRRSGVQIDVYPDNDYLEATVSLSSESIVSSEDNAEAAIELAGTFYNDTQDGGADGQTGDVFIISKLRIEGNGRRSFEMCFSRQMQADGSNNENLDVFDGSSCTSFDGFVPELDVQYTLSINLDRTAGTVTGKLDERTVTVTLPTPAFEPASSRKRIQVSHQGSIGVAVARIHAIATNDFRDDFSDTLPVIAPYRPQYSTQEPGAEITNDVGRARLEAQSLAGEDDRQVQLQLAGTTDYLSADLTLSSESMATGEGSATALLAGLYYVAQEVSDPQSLMGYVFASLRLQLSADGTVQALYCAFQSTTNDFSESVDLVNPASTTPENECLTLPGSWALDTEYAAVLRLDRIGSRLVFSLGEAEAIYDIMTSVNELQRFPFKSVRARSEGGGTAVALFDHLETAPGAPAIIMSENALPMTDDETTPNEDDPEVTTGSTTGSNSGSGGSCSIASGGSSPFLPGLALVAMICLWLRRRSGSVSQSC